MPDDDEDGLTGVGIDVANALVDNPRRVIRAGAGAGRTTLLQWLAAKLADRMVGPGAGTCLRAGAAAGRRLATNPLLAGLICALYQDRHMHLPRDRRSLYEAALELPVTRLVIRDRSLAAGLGGIPVELPLTELILDNRPPDRDLRDIDRLTGLTHVEFFGTPAPHELAALGRLPELTALTVHQPGDVRGLVRLPALRRLAVDGIPAARRAAVLTDLRAADHLTVTVDGAAQPYEKGS